MQVDSSPALGEFRIGRRPCTSRFQITLKGLSAVFARNVEVHENMSLRRQKIMEFGRVEVGKRRRNVIPFPLRCPFFGGILRRTTRVFLVENGLRTVELQPAFLLRRLFIDGLRILRTLLEFLYPEARIPAPNSRPVRKCVAAFTVTKIILQFLRERPL